MLDKNTGRVVTLWILFLKHVWSKNNSDKLLSSRQEAIDAAERAGSDIEALLAQAGTNLLEKDRPQTLREFFTSRYLLNADIDRRFFINIDLCVNEIKRTSNLLEFFRTCTEKDFEDWFSNREPISDEVKQKRWNLASLRHKKRVKLAKAENENAVKKEKERKEKERCALIKELEEKKRRRLENQGFLNQVVTSSFSSEPSGPLGFNARRGHY